MRKNKQLATLPEHLSYSTVRIESPLGKIVYLPRRELFDVRAQLLQENSSASDQVVENLDKSDLRSGIYEGGFKTWECSIDLASFLLDRGPRKDIDELVKCDQILEVFITIPLISNNVSHRNAANSHISARSRQRSSQPHPLPPRSVTLPE